MLCVEKRQLLRLVSPVVSFPVLQQPWLFSNAKATLNRDQPTPGYLQCCSAGQQNGLEKEARIFQAWWPHWNILLYLFVVVSWMKNHIISYIWTNSTVTLQPEATCFSVTYHFCRLPDLWNHTTNLPSSRRPGVDTDSNKTHLLRFLTLCHHTGSPQRMISGGKSTKKLYWLQFNKCINLSTMIKNTIGFDWLVLFLVLLT